MTVRTDLTRWNRSGLSRFRYVDGNAPAFLEFLRDGLARRFGGDDPAIWQALHAVPLTEDLRERLRRVESQYGSERRDVGWEIVRLFARSCHILTGHVDAYANEGFLGTATQWDHVRRLVEMLDYHPAPPASAFTSVVLVAKPGAKGPVAKGLQMKYAPASGPAATFETLEDVVIDDALNELRPEGYGRNPDPLTGTQLTFDGAVKHIKTGEPVVLDDEHGTLQARVVQGVLESAESTVVTVWPPLPGGFKAGYTIVHAQPADRLSPKGPAVASSNNFTTLYLTDPPGDLQAGEVVYVSDSVNEYYRTVNGVDDRQVRFGSPLGTLLLTHATLARPELVTVSLPKAKQESARGDEIVVRVAGDYSRLTGKRIAALSEAEKEKSPLTEFSVISTVYTPVVQAKDDPDAGHTLLHISSTDKNKHILANPQTMWVPPVGGAWRVDRPLLRLVGFLPAAVVVGKPKKTAASDLAAIVRGNQIAWARLASVDIDVPPGAATLTAKNGWREWVGGDFYLADTSVYGHFKQQLRVSGWRDNRTKLIGSQVTLGSAPDALRTGTRLLVESAGSEPFVANALLVAQRVVTLSRALPSDATVDSLVLRGNIAKAGHGESKSERVLGSGSASQSNQVFLLKISDVSFVADSTQATGVRADIAVRVDGAEWKQVSTLNDSGPADPHYVVRMTEDGHILIGFGDGTNGRRLPTGTNNIRVALREGTGLAGNIPAGSLTKPVKPHALVAAVRQLTPATGGNDMETTASLRENAPASLLTLERAVSLNDFGFLAGSHSSVWQARAFPRQSGFKLRDQIEVVVVPANGGPLGELAATLAEFLQRHGVPGVAITVTEYSRRTFTVDVELSVDEAMFVADDVKVAVERALRQAFSLVQRRLGQDVFLSEIYKVVENVPGVAHSTIELSDVEHPKVRRLLTDERSVCVLDQCTVRVVRETLPAAPAPGGALASTSTSAPTLGDPRPVGREGPIVIDGVGMLYASRLVAAGHRTVRSVAEIDPDRAAVDMPQPKLWEAIAKAQSLLEIEVDVGVADPVLDRPLVDVAGMTHGALSTATQASADQVTQLRRLVRRLQVSLDAAAFARLTLRDFVPQ